MNICFNKKMHKAKYFYIKISHFFFVSVQHLLYMWSQQPFFSFSVFCAEKVFHEFNLHSIITLDVVCLS